MLISGGVQGSELLKSRKNMVTDKVEVSSFGMVICELLTGKTLCKYAIRGNNSAPTTIVAVLPQLELSVVLFDKEEDSESLCLDVTSFSVVKTCSWKACLLLFNTRMWFRCYASWCV